MFGNISRLFCALPVLTPPTECKPLPPCSQKPPSDVNLFGHKSLSEWQSEKFGGFISHVIHEALEQEKAAKDQLKIDVVLPPPMA